MRITARIATAGQAGMSRFPVPSKTVDECKKPDGTLDDGLVSQALNCEGVMSSSDDNLAVKAFTLEYLKQQRSVVERLAETGYGSVATEGDEQTSVHTTAKTRLDASCERRLAKGRCAFVRSDIDMRQGRIRVRLSYANPREVVGYTEEFAGYYAEMCARILVYLRAEFKRLSNQEILLVEGENCAGIFKRAEDANDWFDRRDAARADVERRNAKRRSCPSMVNGYCSPSNPKCECYLNGRCVEAVMPEEFAEVPQRK